jgi:hypothetical protein
MSIKPEEPGWDEFKDPEIVDWKRARAAIEHENCLTNHRFTWLLSSQGFLVGAFLVVWQASLKAGPNSDESLRYLWVLCAISFVAFFICLHLTLGLLAAHEQHERIELWCKSLPKEPTRHFPLTGSDPKFIKTIPYFVLGLVFALTWVAFIAVAFFDYLRSHQWTVSMVLGIGALLAITYALGVLRGRRVHRAAA